jgi:hypothetical protein
VIHTQCAESARERGLAAASGASDDVGYFEWSAPTDEISLENAAFANPGLNITIHPDNIRAVFNDPPDVVMTEVLNRWVQTISSVIGAKEWQACGDESIDLDVDKLTWMAIDISPDRKNAALVGAQKLGSESFVINFSTHGKTPSSLMIVQLPMMQRLIAANIPLSICCTQGAQPVPLPRVWCQPVFQSMTWIRLTRKLVMNCWVPSILVA